MSQHNIASGTAGLGATMIEQDEAPYEIAEKSLLATAGLGGVRFIDGATLCATISLPEAIELVEAAMRRLSADAVPAPTRWSVPVSPQGYMGLMPGADEGLRYFGIKVISLFDKRARAGLPSHQGLMLLFDLDNGRPVAAVDANTLTGIRTAAASAVATRLLARKDARSLALIGTGEQARWHARAIPLVRPIEEIRLWNRSKDAARSFADSCCGHIENVIILDTVEEAVRDADIICTLTHAPEPILFGEWLREGQHINLVGSSAAASSEVDAALVKRSHFIVDCRENALVQAGELLNAIRAGAVDEQHIAGELGELLDGRAIGRIFPKTITVYKSLGHIAQDIAVAAAALRKIAA